MRIFTRTVLPKDLLQEAFREISGQSCPLGINRTVTRRTDGKCSKVFINYSEFIRVPVIHDAKILLYGEAHGEYESDTYYFIASVDVELGIKTEAAIADEIRSQITEKRRLPDVFLVTDYSGGLRTRKTPLSRRVYELLTDDIRRFVPEKYRAKIGNVLHVTKYDTRIISVIAEKIKEALQECNPRVHAPSP